MAEGHGSSAARSPIPSHPPQSDGILAQTVGATAYDTTKIGLWLLLLLGWGALVHILLALTNKEVLWPFVLWMVVVWVPIFGGITWGTRRALRNIQNARRNQRR